MDVNAISKGAALRAMTQFEKNEHIMRYFLNRQSDVKRISYDVWEFQTRRIHQIITIKNDRITILDMRKGEVIKYQHLNDFISHLIATKGLIPSTVAYDTGIYL